MATEPMTFEVNFPEPPPEMLEGMAQSLRSHAIAFGASDSEVTVKDGNLKWTAVFADQEDCTRMMADFNKMVGGGIRPHYAGPIGRA